MQLPGHVGVALLVYAPVAALAIRRGRPRRARMGLAGVLALAMAPDVDLYLTGVPHRGVTHTLLAVAVAAGVVALLVGILRPRRAVSAGPAARFGGTVGGSAVLSHLVADALTPMGIRTFLPLGGRTYALSLVYAADPAANAGLLVAGVVVFATAVSLAGSPLPAGAPARLFRRLRRT